jgi:hypothetical protein
MCTNNENTDSKKETILSRTGIKGKAYADALIIFIPHIQKLLSAFFMSPLLFYTLDTKNKKT